MGARIASTNWFGLAFCEFKVLETSFKPNKRADWCIFNKYWVMYSRNNPYCLFEKYPKYPTSWYFQ